MLSSFSEVATEIHNTLLNRMGMVTGQNVNDLGLYIFTGENWGLAGSPANHLPESVEFSFGNSSPSLLLSEKLNAFEWVWESTRPVLIQQGACSERDLATTNPTVRTSFLAN